MLSEIKYMDDSFHDIFVDGDWNLEKIKNDFDDGDTPTILTRVLRRRSCSVDTIKLLLEYGADINCRDERDYTPLMISLAITNDKEVIRILLEGGTKVNAVDWEFKTPLLLYLEREDCSVDIVKILLDFKADVNHKDAYGNSALRTAIRKAKDGAVIQTLVEGGAEVNDSTLLVLLRERINCSVNTVKLLLATGINVNYVDARGDSPLTIALKNSRSEKIVQMLLEEGALVNVCDRQCRSPLCLAFKHSSNDMVKLLFDAGASPITCLYHSSPFHCATDYSNSGLREDILTLLLGSNSDVNFVNPGWQSVMCFALQHGAKAKDIQLLLSAGASLNSCLRHTSSLICATSVCDGTPLRAEVIKLLLDNGASVNGENLKVLQNALRYSKYDTEAIQLLLDIPGMDAFVASNKLLLHHAADNVNCRTDALQLLINRKVQIPSLDDECRTPLHYAARNRGLDPNVIKLLLQNGLPVNAKTFNDETPLMVAERHFATKILKELLLAGADVASYIFNRRYHRFRPSEDTMEFLDFLVQNFDTCPNPEMLYTYEMLVKFFLLQNPQYNIENFQQTFSNYESTKLLIFLNQVLIELEKMNSLQVSNGRTLRMFVARDSLSVEDNYDLDKILMHMTKNSFPVFFDIVSARISRPIMEAELKKLQVYTNKIHSMEQVHLNSDIVFIISKYLPDEDLFKFIVAFYKPFYQNDSGETSKHDSLVGKRSCEPSTHLAKCPKL